MRPAVFTFPAASTTAITTAQTLAGAGALVIDGPLLDKQATMVGVRRVVLPGIQRVITLSSTGDLSAANITIAGKDVNGVAVTETRVGPSNNTVATTAQFSEIDSITSDAALGTAMSVGTGATGQTRWALVDYFQDPVNVGIVDAITTTLTASSYYTSDPLDTPDASIVETKITNLSSITGTGRATLTEPCRGVRTKIESSSGSGALVSTVTQAG